MRKPARSMPRRLAARLASAERLRLAMLALALLIAAAMPVSAQDQRTLSGRGAGRLSASLSERMMEAQHLMESHPEQALALLEGLGEREAQHPNVRFLKAQICRQLGRGEEAETFLRALMEEFPESGGYREELARVLFMSGRDAQAMQILEQGFASERPRADDFEGAAALLQSVSRFDLIEGVYRRGLAALPASDERGRQRLIVRLLDHLLLEDRAADMLRTLAGELQHSKDPKIKQGLFEHGEQLVSELPEPRALLVLADSLSASEAGPALAGALRGLYLAAGEYEAFARRVLEVRQPPGDRPLWLYNQGLRCLTEGPPGQAEARRRAAEAIFAKLLEAKPDEELAIRARWQLIRIRKDREADRRLCGEIPSEAEIEKTLGLMSELWLKHPSSLWASEAFVVQLRYLRETLGRAEEADRLLRLWLANPDRGDDTESLWALELELGENLLALNRFDEARGHYASLVKTSRESGLTGWSRYRLAQLLILDKQLPAAQDSLAALAKEMPGSPLANDALDLALLMAESQQWPSTVREFLEGALVQELAARPVEAAERLLVFAREFPDDEAAPALLYRAGILLERGLSGKRAIESWLLLADLHAGDFRAPQGLEKAARLALRMGDRVQARELLDRLIREHPESPLRPSLKDLQESLMEGDA